MNESIPTTEATVTSRMFAEWAGEEHENVLCDIESILRKVGSSLNASIVLDTYIDSQGKQQHQYKMDKKGALFMSARYDSRVLIRVINRLEASGITSWDFYTQDANWPARA